MYVDLSRPDLWLVSWETTILIIYKFYKKNHFVANEKNLMSQSAIFP